MDKNMSIINLMPKRKTKNHNHYIIFAFATVLFWRGTWHLLDRIPLVNDYYISDAASALIGLLLIWWVSRGFRDLH
jgi:hypothetical protein